jgi:hypothetical protein
MKYFLMLLLVTSAAWGQSAHVQGSRIEQVASGGSFTKQGKVGNWQGSQIKTPDTYSGGSSQGSQCVYDLHIDTLTYATTYYPSRWHWPSASDCEKALPTGSDVPIISITKNTIKVLSNGKAMALAIVGTHE